MARPLVSVIIVTRNRGALLQRAVDSVVAQPHRPLELVIIDNASDQPVSVQAADLAVTMRRNDRMLSAAVNRSLGIDAARGELICFLDDDDYYTPAKMETLLTAIEGQDMAYGNTQMLGPDGALGLCVGPPGLTDVMLSRHIHLNSLMIRRSFLGDLRFDPEMTTYEDVDFVFRLIQKGPAIVHCDTVLAVWNCDRRPDQLTNRNYKRAHKNWKILCDRFAPEIRASKALARFYLKKMFLLAVIELHPIQAWVSFFRWVRFGYLGA
jgi:glycosyltransferase involved in cell wall biosynthesis